MFKTSCLWFLSVVLSTVWADCGVTGSGEKVEILLWPGGSWAGYLHKDYLPAPNYLGHDVDKSMFRMRQLIRKCSMGYLHLTTLETWNCPIDCRYTTDKTRLANVDAVLFEAQPITSYYDDYKRHPPQFPMKYIGQHWINHGYETHVYFNLYGDPGYLDYIDGNMTFSQSSVVPITFTCNWGGGELADLLKPPPPKFKDKCIVMMATNCISGGATFRTAYANELMDYMDVHSFGQCLHNKDLPEEMQFPIYSDHGASMRNKVRIFKDYKFVLTMENNNITDYVTEKMMNVFQAGAVPVYMGAPNVDPDWVPGKHSIIKTDDFSGPKEMAEYLNFLCQNDEEYYKYFEWKKNGFSEKFKEKMRNCVFYGAECRLCQYLAEQRNKLQPQQRAAVNARINSSRHYFALKMEKEQYVEVGQNLTNFDVGSFTVSAWIQLTSSLNAPVFTRGNIFTFGIKQIWKRGYAELCVLGECFYGSHPIVLNSWTHVAAVYDWENRAVRFYGNGLEDEAVSIPWKQLKKEYFAENATPILLGTEATKQKFFTGFIDNVSFWKIALTPQEAKKLVYGSYSSGHESVVAFWSFDQLPATRSAAVDEVAGIVGILHGSPGWMENLSKPLVTTGPCL